MTPELDDVITPRPSDLGEGFVVRRALPHARLRNIGPFVFFDEMGPVVFEEGKGLEVRPHPHIGLATVTYLFEGEILHRDSLGTVVPIRPGEVNWMTAGRGIVHSERTAPALRRSGSRLAGLQVWVALPREYEETDPAFAHFEAHELPQLQLGAATIRVILGEAYGACSPVNVFSPTFYVDVALPAGSQLTLPTQYEERGVYVLKGQLQVGASSETFGSSNLLVFASGRSAVVTANGADARFVVFGGAPLDGPRIVWWNFVSSSSERVEQAKALWAAGEFPPVPGETDFIPLPASKPAKVDYP